MHPGQRDSTDQMETGYEEEAGQSKPSDWKQWKERKNAGNKKFLKRKKPMTDERPVPQKKKKRDRPKKGQNESESATSAPVPGAAKLHSVDAIDPEVRRKTVFVSNLDFKLPEERLKEIFESQNIGQIVAVRLKKAHHRDDLTRGFGYVEFDSVENALKALTLDRHLVDGRPMFVSEYKDRNDDDAGPSNVAAEKYHFGAGLEKNKLFVRNIPKTATEEDLKTIFE